jgi:ribulose-phosphate 3-epimerase
MKFSLGIKSDPVQYRYTYEWLFALMEELEIHYLQLGSFFELYILEEGYFHRLRNQAESHNIRIKSCFSSHRELGGFLSGDPFLERAAAKSWKRYLDVAAWLGVDFIGSNMGAVYRDHPEHKQSGIDCWIEHMKENLHLAQDIGLQALTLEPMSSASEPPSSIQELDNILGILNGYHRQNPESTVPMYLCGDISHGLADREGLVVESNTELFEHEVPYLAEFHFKNTDARYEATFGFSEEECRRGIIDLEEFRNRITQNADRFPVDHLVGYFETDGPKRGRDYSDHHLEQVLTETMITLKRVFSDL